MAVLPRRCAIPAFYAVGLIARTGDNFTTTEFWRFWVVHLWVEDFLELFTTVMVAYMFVLLGVVREKVALTVVFLDIVLYSVGGVVGTMHHLYFSGTPAETMAFWNPDTRSRCVVSRLRSPISPIRRWPPC